MSESDSYKIVETTKGWAVKRVLQKGPLSLHHNAQTYQSEHGTEEAAQSEADRLNSNQ